MRSLKQLSDKELLNRLSKLVKKERDLTLEILDFIIEVENRKIYRQLGYSSMFVYCTEGLGYSESSANRRIYAARAIRKCPKAHEYLRDGFVNLATLALVWQHITPELLEEIRDKSYRQVQVIVSRFNPMIKQRDITKPVVVRRVIPDAGERQNAGANSKSSSVLSLAESTASKELGEKTLRRGGKKSSSDDISTPPKTEAIKMHQVSCLLDEKVMQMLDRCKELLSGKYPCGMDYNLLLTELATTWLDKNDLITRSERREKRKKPKKSKHARRGETTRHINPSVRDQVYKRDGGRCTFISPTGQRCNSKWDLEIHHCDVPFAMGGDNSVNNLKLLCAAHNKLEAERVYGQDQVKQFYRKVE